MDILSLVIGLIGIGVAVYQGSEKKKLDRLIKAQAWHTYSLVRRTWGVQQASFQKYKEKYSQDIDTELFEYLCRSDTFLHNLHLESIRQIQLSEQNFDSATVKLWVHAGRIRQEQAEIFLETAPVDRLTFFQSLEMHLRQFLHEKIIKKNEIIS